ncbi:Hypothetical predicted protein [Cloeon dipterum]|uniref:Cytochrome P450 n=1 Tax=Cloeon dipterum TaxID=197152 RepID=A0A8S1CH81_9INSE|nr:Hypothetical predicted protein [Cloeon dipterum]
MFLANLKMHRRSLVASKLLFAGHRPQTTVAAVASSSNLVKTYDEIPGPKPLPIIGNAWRFMPQLSSWDMTDFVQWSRSMMEEYGKIVKISKLPGRRDMIMVFDPVVIAEVFKREGQYPESFKFESMEYYRQKVRPDYFEGFRGIFNENGKTWHEARLILNQPMMNTAVANLYVPKTDQVAKDFVKLVKELRDDKMEMPDDFHNEMHKWSLESISLISYDTRLGCLKKNLAKGSDAQILIHSIAQLYKLMYELDLKIPLWKFVPTKALNELIENADNMLKISQKYVERAREKDLKTKTTDTSNMSVLQRILQRDSNTKRAVIMGMDIIFGGVDSTSNTAGSILYLLACNPDKQEKLYQELKAIAPADPNEDLNPDHLNNMKYLKACIKEAMRMIPVTNGTVRTLPQDVVLGDYLIPKDKADIWIFNSTLYMLDEHFPDADKFIPERWLREGDSCPVRKASEAHPYTFLPFGRGTRQCPGTRFVKMELETFIARMLLEYKLEWHQPPLKFISKIIRTPQSPLKLTVLDRNN